MKLEKNDTLLFIGDSITDCGRSRPIGEKSGLGNGYVSQINAILNGTRPHQPIRVLNTGISGNRVCDLKERWENDVIELQPDWLSIMIGINDVWRQFDDAQAPKQIGLTEYKETLRFLVKRTKTTLKGLVLMTPFYIEANKEDPMRAMMDQYSQVVRQIAEEQTSIFVDVQSAFDHYLIHQPTQSLCGDRVHPNSTGHLIIARAFLDSIGYQWNRP